MFATCRNHAYMCWSECAMRGLKLYHCEFSCVRVACKLWCVRVPFFFFFLTMGRLIKTQFAFVNAARQATTPFNLTYLLLKFCFVKAMSGDDIHPTDKASSVSFYSVPLSVVRILEECFINYSHMPIHFIKLIGAISLPPSPHHSSPHARPVRRRGRKSLRTVC